MREKRQGDKSKASNFKEDWQILKRWAGVPYSELWHPYTTDRDPIYDEFEVSLKNPQTNQYLVAHGLQ